MKRRRSSNNIAARRRRRIPPTTRSQPPPTPRTVKQEEPKIIGEYLLIFVHYSYLISHLLNFSQQDAHIKQPNPAIMEDIRGEEAAEDLK
jgi:hypothetical protein